MLTQDDNLKLLWDSIDSRISETDDADFARFLSAVNPPAVQSRLKRSLKWIGRVAAVLFIPLSAWTIYLAVKSSEPAPMPLVAWNETFVAPGETADVVLPDGTKVLLNSGSHLVCPESFETVGRQIFFSGEADFEVVSDKDHPFTISTGGTRVKVLGTHFNLNSYSEENILKVQLYEGSVEFSYEDEGGETVSSLIAPGEELSYNKSTAATTITSISEEASWKSGTYYFRGQSLEKISRSLERIYGVRIEILSEPVKQLPFYMVISRNDNIDDIVELLSSDSRFSVHKKGNFIEIK